MLHFTWYCVLHSNIPVYKNVFFCWTCHFNSNKKQIPYFSRHRHNTVDKITHLFSTSIITVHRQHFLLKWSLWRTFIAGSHQKNIRVDSCLAELTLFCFSVCFSKMERKVCSILVPVMYVFRRLFKIVHKKPVLRPLKWFPLTGLSPVCAHFMHFD